MPLGETNKIWTCLEQFVHDTDTINTKELKTMFSINNSRAKPEIYCYDRVD